MLVASKRAKHLHTLPTSITIGNAQIPFKQSVKNLCFTLDCHLTMNAHVSNIARTCYFELHRLAYICRFLTSTATATLVSAFVLSRFDYCNSLLFGSTHDVTYHLQRIQNYAARVILRLPMSSSITIHLKSLHWLPVKVRSTYKIACLCYHCHSCAAPSYVTDMLQKNPSHTHNTRSSSYTMPLLNRPAHNKATLGGSYFSSSSVWNFLMMSGVPMLYIFTTYYFIARQHFMNYCSMRELSHLIIDRQAKVLNTLPQYLFFMRMLQAYFMIFFR